MSVLCPLNQFDRLCIKVGQPDSIDISINRKLLKIKHIHTNSKTKHPAKKNVYCTVLVTLEDDRIDLVASQLEKRINDHEQFVPSIACPLTQR